MQKNLTEDGLFNNVSVGQSDFDGMRIVGDRGDWNGHVFVSEHDVAAVEQSRLEGEIARLDSILQRNLLPLDGERRAVVGVLDGRRVAHARVKVGHQRRDVLSGC